MYKMGSTGSEYKFQSAIHESRKSNSCKKLGYMTNYQPPSLHIAVGSGCCRWAGAQMLMTAVSRKSDTCRAQAVEAVAGRRGGRIMRVRNKTKGGRGVMKVVLGLRLTHTDPGVELRDLQEFVGVPWAECTEAGDCQSFARRGLAGPFRKSVIMLD